MIHFAHGARCIARDQVQLSDGYRHSMSIAGRALRAQRFPLAGQVLDCFLYPSLDRGVETLYEVVALDITQQHFGEGISGGISPAGGELVHPYRFKIAVPRISYERLV